MQKQRVRRVSDPEAAQREQGCSDTARKCAVYEPD
jgi:hypothetical protein